MPAAIPKAASKSAETATTRVDIMMQDYRIALLSYVSKHFPDGRTSAIPPCNAATTTPEESSVSAIPDLAEETGLAQSN